ncbi:MAG: uroporphyrinogen decarboxylase [Nitrospirae bacterium]|nr:uroporphyrinogen decarboxylase [Nitrospirota bacterium]
MQDLTPGFGGLSVVSFESRMADEAVLLIRKYGGQPISAPSLREVPLEVNTEALEFAERLMKGHVDVVLFLTGVGTRAVIRIASSRHDREAFLRALAGATVVTRGPKPIVALGEVGLKPTVTVPEPNTWRDVLATLDRRLDVRGKVVAVQEYGRANAELLAGLRDRGAEVFRVPVYQWALPEDTAPLVHALRGIAEGAADVLLFSNAAQVDHVLEVAREEGLEASIRESMERLVVASIGPITSEALRERGFPVDFEPRRSKIGVFIQEASLACPALVARKREVRVQIGVWERPQPAAPLAGERPLPCLDGSFMKACRREPVERVPIWLMRQAGRYMKAYRDVRSRVSFLELCHNPQLAAEVTVTAAEQLGVDAAIIFADILLVTEPMGVGLEFLRGEGPAIHRPVRTAEDVDLVREVDAESSLGFVFEAIRLTRAALAPRIPLIGFAGAPFTVASYVTEGKASEHYLHTKGLMLRDTGAWNALLGKITRATTDYLNGQIRAGAQAVQVFDSWVGCLSPHDYEMHVLPHMRRLFAGLQAGVPVIHFGTGTAALLELMKAAGGAVIGVDWRVELGAAWDRLGEVAVQGNLDPAVLLTDEPTIRREAWRVLDQGRGRPGHIFNLGHGVLPQTPEENVHALIRAVHEYPVEKV